MKLYNYKYELLAYLDDMSPTVDKVLGGISTLTFTINKDVYTHSSGETVSDDRFDLIENEKLIEYDNELYIIKDCSPSRDELGIVTKEVTCKHISVELSSTKVNGAWGYSPSVEYFEPPYNKPATLQVALKDLLKNHTSGWEIGVFPVIEKNRTFEFEWNTPMEIIMDLSEVYNFIPHFRTEVVNGVIKKYVDILTDDYGEVKGYYRHDSTLSTIRKPINSDGITTRLYVFGYNDITINEMYSETKTFNGVSYNIHTFGRSYVDNFDYFLSQGYTYEECLKHFVRVDQIKDDLYVDPTDLYDYAKDHISKVGMPTVSYTVNVNDVEFVGKPELELGHKIRIYDKEIGIDLTGRVSKINFNHDNPAAKTIEITNYYAYLSEVDLLTDLVLKQDKLGTTAIRRNSKFANSVVVNNVTGIVVQAKNSGVSTLGIDEEELMNYRDVVRIGQYEKDKYGIQVLDGQIQMDRQDGITRVNIDNQEGIVIYNNPNGDGFTDEHRVFYVDVEGKLVAEKIVVRDGYYYLRDGQEIEAVISGINESIDLVESGIEDVAASVEELEREQVRLDELTKAENIIATVTESKEYIDGLLSKVDSTALAEESKRIEGLITTATSVDRIVSTVTGSEKYAQDLLAKADSATVTATIDSVKTELQGKVDSVSGEVAQAKLDIEKTNQSLSLKAEKTEVYTKAETDLALSSKLDDGALDGVIERISSTETEIQIQAGQIASKVEKTTYETAIGNINSTLNGKADSSVVDGVIERVTSAESAITQTAEAIESKVSKSEYQTGMASKTDNSTVTALTSRVSTAESTLTQHADSIALKASKTDVYTKTETDSKLESIEIGAVNLIRDSEFTASPSKWIGIGSLWKIDTVNKYDDVNIVYITRSGLTSNGWVDITSEPIEVSVGDTYTGSFYAKFSGFDGVQDYVLIRLYGYKADGTRVDIKEKMLNGTQANWKRVVVTANIPSGVKTLRLAASMRRNGSCYLAKPKLEKGNKATDWATSPKDTMSRVESVESELKVQADKIEAKVSKTDYAKDMSSFGTRLSKAESSVSQTADEIKQKVSKTEYAEDKNGILTRLGTAETGISQNAGAIALKASKTDLTNGLANKADNSTVSSLSGRVSKAESELNVQAGQISQKVSKTEYDGNIKDLQSAIGDKANSSDLSALAKRVSTAESSITQTAEQITQKVSKTEYDKGLAGKADTSTVTALGTRLSTAETTLTQQAGQIALKASKTDVYTKGETDGKLDGIAIGGTNLAKLSKTFGSMVGLGDWKIIHDASNHSLLNIVTDKTTWAECQMNTYPPYNSLVGLMVVSFEYKESATGVLSFNIGAFNNNTRVSELVNWVVSSDFKKETTSDGWTRVWKYFNIGSLNNVANANNYKLQFKKTTGKTGTVSIRKVKFEKGNKATDWTPAPEDIDTKISSVEAELKVQSDAITQTVKKTDYDKTVKQLQADVGGKADNSTVTSITERLTTAEASIKTTSDAIKQTVTKTEWTSDKQTINSAIAGKADNSTVTSVSNRLSTAEGSITTLSNQISLKASKTDVYTKGEVNSKVDSISVGGRNLITNSDFSETRNWGLSSDATYTSDGMNGKRAITVKRASPAAASIRTGATNGTLSMKDTIPKGTEFTLSAWVYVYDGGSYPSLTDNSSSIFLRMWRKDNSTLWDVINLQIKMTQTKNGWVRLVGSGTTAYEAHGGSAAYPPQIGIYLSGYGMFKVSDVKLEYGNKATDWSPNPADLIERIESAEAEIKVNSDSITQTVKKTDYTGEKLVSMINQTADSVKIAAKNINLTGAVTFSSFDSSTQGKINTIETTASAAKTTAETAKSTATTAKSTADTAKSTADTAKSTATTAQTTANTAKSTADTAKSTATTAKSTADAASSTATNASQLAAAIASGKMLYKDATFKTGANGVKTYNNSGGTDLTVSRIPKPSDCPSSSTHCMEIKVTGMKTSPSWGGFTFHQSSRVNAKFIVKIIAKIPTGRNLMFATNSTGNGASDKWFTSTAGTGGWTEYIHEIKCGSSGTFSTTAYYYLTGGSNPSSAAPLIWYLSYATIYDVTETEIDYDTAITTAQNAAQNASSIAQSAQSAANTANNKLSAWAHSNNTTLIDGSKIYTGSITAQMITSGTFKGVNFEAGGSGNDGTVVVKDINNKITFHANKNGVYATNIVFPDLITSSGAVTQSSIVSASGNGFYTEVNSRGTLYAYSADGIFKDGKLILSEITHDLSGGSMVMSGSYKASYGGDGILFTDNKNNKTNRLSSSGDALSVSGGFNVNGSITAKTESRFSNGAYSDPWSGTACAIKASGHIASSGIIRGKTFEQSSYGTPIEIGRYIDMHQVGSNTDVDVRLIADGRQGLIVARGDDLSRYIAIGTGSDDRYIHNNTSGKYLQLKDDGRLTYDSYTVPHNWKQNFTPFIYSNSGRFVMAEGWGNAVFLGDLVYIQGRVRGSRGGHSGTVNIGGLPVACVGGYPSLNFAFFGGIAKPLGYDAWDFKAYIESGGSHAILNYTDKNTGGWHTLQCSHLITGNIDISFSAIYRWR